MAALVKAWLFLCALTLAALAVAAAGALPGGGLVEVGVVAAVAGLKASTILRYFLGLRAAPAGWRTLFSVYLILLCGAVFAIHAAGDILRPAAGAHVERKAR